MTSSIELFARIRAARSAPTNRGRAERALREHLRSLSVPNAALARVTWATDPSDGAHHVVTKLAEIGTSAALAGETPETARAAAEAAVEEALVPRYRAAARRAREPRRTHSAFARALEAAEDDSLAHVADAHATFAARRAIASLDESVWSEMFDAAVRIQAKKDPADSPAARRAQARSAAWLAIQGAAGPELVPGVVACAAAWTVLAEAGSPPGASAWEAVASSFARILVGLDARRALAILAPLVEAFEHGLWLFWVTTKEIVAVMRPGLRFDAEGRVHAEDGPALAWGSGIREHFWHGIAVPAHVVERPETIRVAEIESESNVEVRRVLIERFGAGRYLAARGARTIDHDPRWGTLYRCNVREDEPLVMVRVTDATPAADGTRKEYWLRVPPDTMTAREAVAWTFGMRELEWSPDAET